MNPLVNHLCMLLAGANLDQDELTKLFALLKRTDTRVLLNQIDTIRSFSERFANVVEDSGPEVDKASNRPPQASAVNRIVHMLKVEAGMSTTEATRQLAAMLRSKFPDTVTTEAVRPLPKKSLAEWIIRASRYINERDLLHVATVLRNSRVHAKPNEWLPKD